MGRGFLFLDCPTIYRFRYGLLVGHHEPRPAFVSVPYLVPIEDSRIRLFLGRQGRPVVSISADFGSSTFTFPDPFTGRHAKTGRGCSVAVKVWGYVRVSKADQNPDRQVDLLMREYAIAKADMYVDKFTGTRFDRPALGELQKVLREGDTVVVESLSRVSRKSADLIAMLDDWHSRGIRFVSHKENLDFSSATGKLMLALFAALAQFERDNLVERTREALAAARERGRFGGRPRTDKKALDKAIRLHSAGSHSAREICEITKVSKSVLYRELKSRGQRNTYAGEKDGRSDKV